jgi:hypothetical protein
MRPWAKISFALLLLCRSALAQGFVNLDFEDANNLGTPGSFNQISATDAFPGWTVYARYIVYDDISLSGGSISICDSGPPFYFPPIQGTYFALLFSANTPGDQLSISIGQTGQIPPSANSITFWGNDEGMQITFNGQPLSFSSIGSTANYSIYGADISAFAGQTGQLLFTVPPLTGSDNLDNIQFSSSSVPEPSEFALIALGALLLGFRRWRNSF